jgi:hypothetical protein
MCLHVPYSNTHPQIYISCTKGNMALILRMYICICVYIMMHAHTHTHTLDLEVCVYVCICKCIFIHNYEKKKMLSQLTVQQSRIIGNLILLIN